MIFKNATEAWDYWYDVLKNQELNESSRVGKVAGEVLNSVTTITDPTRGIVFSKIRNMPMRYAVGELIWYLSGSNKVRDIKKYSTFWEGISDDGETLNSAYGYRIHHEFGFDQWDYVKDMLTNDPNSRQAVIHIKDATNKKTRDMPCTCLIQFLLRENKLYCTVYMRSNDLWTGFPYDVFAFTALQIKMAMELGVDLGSYTHIAGSLHLYEKDLILEETDEKDSLQI